MVSERVLVNRPLTHAEFVQSMSNLYHELPEEIKRNVKVLFCPEGCWLHTQSRNTGHSSYVFGQTYGDVVMMCYDSFARINRFDEVHLYKVLIHELEHANFPDGHHHSEH